MAQTPGAVKISSSDNTVRLRLDLEFMLAWSGPLRCSLGVRWYRIRVPRRHRKQKPAAGDRNGNSPKTLKNISSELASAIS
jgi:hypothetical protein